MDYAAAEDGKLIKTYLQGDEEALGFLISRHEQRIFAFIISRIQDNDLANDIFQETFVKIIRTLKAGRYNEKGKFLQWAMRIAHNLVMDYYRQRKRMPTTAPTDDFNIFDVIKDDALTAEDAMIKEQVYRDLKDLILALPEEQRHVLELRIYGKVTFKEIAEQTDVSINTALGRMRYALINIRKMMEERKINLYS
jgi:RNA polymerase sigma-70 factor (ECF subfamily)